MKSLTEGDVNATPRRARWQEENLGPETRELLAADADVYLHQSLSTPCLNALEGVEGPWLQDLEGRRFLDFHGNGVHQIGYGHPRVVAGLKDQLDHLSFVPRRFTCQVSVQAAQTLIRLAGGRLSRVLFTTGGSAAIGLALKIARKATGRHKTISLWDSFHGAGLDAISVGGEALFRAGIGPLLPGTSHIPPYNSYRCLWGECASCPLRCLDYLEYVLEREPDVACLVMEPVRATDVHIPPRAYFTRLRQLCDRFGVLLVFDEVPTAFGRTGRWFVHHHFGIEPDLLVLGKGLGGGIVPVGAVLARDDLNVGADVALGHYTHEKSPLASRAIVETVAVIEGEGLIERAQGLGEQLKHELAAWKASVPLVGDVRSLGLLAAVELVNDRAAKTPATEAAEAVLYRCLSDGVSFKVSQGNILTLMPPLIVTPDQLEEALGSIRRALAAEAST